MNKLVNLYKEIINEGATPILYHFTWDSKLENILSTNTFYLTSNVSSVTDKKHSGGKDYYISFSRSKSTKHGYGNKFDQPRGVRIKLDGRKLNSNHKVIPIDYWQYPRTPSLMGGGGDEMEDRVVSNDDEIINANKYIISIDIFIPKDGINPNIIRYAKSLGIKLNFYGDSKSFAFGDPKYSVKPTLNRGVKESDSGESLYFIIDTLTAISFNSPNNKKIILKILEDYGFEYNEVIDLIGKKLEKYNFYLRPFNDMYMTDIVNSLSAEIHNNKSKPSKLIRRINRVFMDDFRRLNATTIKDYLERKMYVGRKTHKDFNYEFNNNLKKHIGELFKEGLRDLNYAVYDEYGNDVNPLSNYTPLLKFLNSKLRLIKVYCSDFILNNSDMYKYNYKISSGEIKSNIDLINGSEEVLGTLEDVTYDDIIRPILYVLWGIDELVSSEVDRIKSENDKQWNFK